MWSEIKKITNEDFEICSVVNWLVKLFCIKTHRQVLYICYDQGALPQQKNEKKQMMNEITDHQQMKKKCRIQNFASKFQPFTE